MTTTQVEELIRAKFPGAKIAVSDLTGGGDHFRAEIADASFAGKSMVDQHRMVYAALGTLVGGPIHALQLVTKTL
jgi:stress-induced morphogen